MRRVIKVDAEREIGRIDQRIYGHFIEHLGRCVYGGIVEEGSPLADAHGFRRDVLDAARRVRVPVLRWPGGNFASGYHWEDGIGPRDHRPRKMDLAWRTEESNRFGTDEFIRYCRELNTEPYICVNAGWGTAEEAAHWVEYCNCAGETHYAALRRTYGHGEPYNVRYWGVGNEVYGNWQIGAKSAGAYARQLVEFAKVMKRVDPSIQIVAVGADRPDWDLQVLRTAGDHIHYISNHQYYGSDDYLTVVGFAHVVEHKLNVLGDVIEIAQAERSPEHPVGIAFDEWNVHRKTGDAELNESYRIEDALFACGVFHAMHRLCNVVTMANLAQMVNILGLISTQPGKMVLSPIYHAFDLYVNHFGSIAIDSFAPGPTFNGQHELEKHVPYVDVSASLSDDRSALYVAVINRHRDEPAGLAVELDGFVPQPVANTWVLSAEPGTMNTYGAPHAVELEQGSFGGAARRFQYTFPPHAAVILEMARHV